MPEGTVVVLPSDAHASLRGLILNGDFPTLAVVPVDGPAAALTSRICAAISVADPAAPLTIVAAGDAALHLPAVALAQRTAHRRVVEYVLVQPVLPEASDVWPDARVTVFDDDPAPVAALRGWDVRPVAALADWDPRVEW